MAMKWREREDMLKALCRGGDGKKKSNLHDSKSFLFLNVRTHMEDNLMKTQ